MRIYFLLFLILIPNFSISIYEPKTKEIQYIIKKFSVSQENKPSNLKQKEKTSQKIYIDKNYILEIESNKIIKSISFKTKTNNKNDYLLGLFEASNELSFINSTPIATIKKLNSKGKNIIEINSSILYKYIRYIPPNKKNEGIFAIKLHGYKESSKLKLKYLNEDKYYQVTNLPLITIKTEEETEPIRDVDINCHIKIINEGKLEINEDAKIKVRGRSTSFIPTKKPFRIKFSTKQKMFNFEGKEKKWTLLANYYDRSILRNDIAFKISELMEFKYTPRCQSVDLIINSNYRGNYYLCDKIEIGINRVNISKLEIGDIDEPQITGGYLLKIDSWASFIENKNNFRTDKGIVGTIEYPEEDDINNEQMSYIKSKLNQFENEIYNNNLDSINLNSYSKYFLVEEFCGDPDHVWSSFYFTKDRNDNKFNFGPVWDFDLAFDNDDRLFPTSNKTEFCFYYSESAGTTKDFIKALIGNKNVIGNIKNVWDELCNKVLNKKILFDFIDEKSKYLKDSAELNFMRWYNGGEREIDFGRKDKNFDEAIEVLKNYVNDRFESLSRLINNALNK